MRFLKKWRVLACIRKKSYRCIHYKLLWIISTTSLRRWFAVLCIKLIAPEFLQDVDGGVVGVKVGKVF